MTSWGEASRESAIRAGVRLVPPGMKTNMMNDARKTTSMERTSTSM
jgi:hypothetical protein